MVRFDTTPPFEPERGHPNAFPDEHPYSDRDVRLALSHPENDVGGGQSYDNLHTPDDAEVVVSTEDEIKSLGEDTTAYIEDGAVIDLSSPFNASNRTVLGGRGRPGVHAGMIRKTTVDESTGTGIIRMNDGPGKLEGIRVQGPSWYPERAAEYREKDPKNALALPGYEDTPGPEEEPDAGARVDDRNAVFSRGINMYAGDCELRNIEVRGFTHSCVSSGAAGITPDNTVTDSHLHNTCMAGYGYPLNLFNGTVISKRNYYNAYRHATTGFGYSESGYRLENDIIGPDCLLTAIDMHNLEENHSGGLTAGGFMEAVDCTWLPKYRMEAPGWYNSTETSVMHSRGYAALENGYKTIRVKSVQEPREAACIRSNVEDGETWQDWVFENNEWGVERWSDDAVGAPVDLEQTGEGVEPGEGGTDDDSGSSTPAMPPSSPNVAMTDAVVDSRVEAMKGVEGALRGLSTTTSTQQ